MHSMCLMQVRYVARNTRKVSMHVMYVVHVRYAVYVKMKLMHKPYVMCYMRCMSVCVNLRHARHVCSVYVRAYPADRSD